MSQRYWCLRFFIKIEFSKKKRVFIILLRMKNIFLVLSISFVFCSDRLLGSLSEIVDVKKIIGSFVKRIHDFVKYRSWISTRRCGSRPDVGLSSIFLTFPLYDQVPLLSPALDPVPVPPTPPHPSSSRDGALGVSVVGQGRPSKTKTTYEVTQL